MPRSIEFYARLGFAVENAFTTEGGTEPVWAELTAGGDVLMISRARETIDPGAQGVLFYLYATDVAGFQSALLASGVQAGGIEYLFWAPRGEFRIEDPDGHILMVTHT